LRLYWDTSAAINAMISPEVRSRLEQDDHFTRSHLFSEFFATMTGRGVGVEDSTGQVFDLVMTGDDAAQWLRGFAANLTVIDLNGAEVLDALDKAQSSNVSGGRVYDYGHVVAALRAKADVILTRNTIDFQGLTGPVRLEWP
jgi:hypothetical protein